MTEVKEWKKLSDFQHARKRNEMYFGSRDPRTQTVLSYSETGEASAAEATWIPAVFTAFREVLDNALDEIITRGFGDHLKVTYDPKTMICTVSDNGRGIPINFDEDEQQYSATVLLSETKAGRNFEERGNSRGMNGIGASVVNFCSEYFQLDINRDKKSFSQRFSEGDGTELVIDQPIIMPSKDKVTGTRVEFKLSEKVYPRRDLPERFIFSRIMEVAFCYPDLKITYNGKPIRPKGLVDKVMFPKHKAISFAVREPGFMSNFWLVPNFFTDGSELSHSLVNAIPAFDGGTHIDAFKRNFFSGLITALERESKKRKLTPNRSDIADGLMVFNITEMDSPSFDSQNKTRLITENSAILVKKALDDPDFFKKVIRTNPDWIESIYQRCAERTQKKDIADISKLAKANKRLKIEDLDDACAVDRSKCVLFLGEGKSAISGIVEARNAEIHGGLPLRGKILNVYGMPLKEVMANETLTKITGAIGLIPGQRVNRSALRYGRVNITTDADEDGKNIAALLVNFFYTLWPELFTDAEKPFIYIFDTPLIIAARGKSKKYWYNDNYDTFAPEDYKGWEITRAKGLAALKKDDWKYALENPKALPITGTLDDCLALLFNPTMADARKEWIGL